MKWKNLIIDYHKRDDGTEASEIFFAAPATENQLKKLQNLFIIPPDELIEIYSNFNGYGVVENNCLNWFMLPIEMVFEIKNKFANEYFNNENNYLKDFIPIYDWGDGDYTGYLVKSNQKAGNLWTFSHESFYEDVNSDKDNYLFNEFQSFIELFTADSETLLNQDSVRFGKNYLESQKISLQKLIENFCESEFENEHYNIAYGDFLSRNTILSYVKALSFPIPDCLRNFYFEHNGFGVFNDDSSEITWFIPPITLLESFASSIKSNYEEATFTNLNSHVPFCKYGLGECYCSFLLNEQGNVTDGIYLIEDFGYGLRVKNKQKYSPTLAWKNISNMLYV